MESDEILVLRGGGRNLIDVRKRDLESYSIPNSVTAIGKKAFKGCSSLSEINVPGNVKSIGADAFMDCTSLFVIRISEGVTTIGKGAFRNCTSLREVYLPNSLSEIRDETFMNCPSLRRIKIPEGIRRLGRSCFADCKSLDTIVLPNSLCSIDSLCFYECNNLKNVYLRKITPDQLTVEKNIISPCDYITRTLYVPNHKVYLFQQHPIFKYFNEIESEQNPELRDWSFSEKRFLYISKDKIEEKGIPGLIILKLAGEPDMPSINQYLCSKIEQIEISDEYNKQISIFNNCWNIQDLNKRGWTLSMIIRYAGNPDLDLTGVFENDNDKQYETRISLSHLKPLIFHLKSKILLIEQSEDFISEISFKENCFTRGQLYNKGWHDCLIDRIEHKTLDGISYYEKSIIISFENDKNNKKLMNTINNSWSKTELSEQGWSSFMLKKLDIKPDLHIGDYDFYLKDHLESIKRSERFRQLTELMEDYRALLNWCSSYEMTVSEFIDNIDFEIPIMDKEELKNNACDSFNDYIDSKRNYSGEWIDGELYEDEWYDDEYATLEDSERRLAIKCMNYLRHEHTPYDIIWRTLRNAYFDEYEEFHYILKSKVNNAIRKTYPWLSKYC